MSILEYNWEHIYGEFVYAILAGIMIGIGGCALLSISIPVVGSVFFAFGLMTIIAFKFKLYTGLIGYYHDKGNDTLMSYVILGNLIGTAFVGLVVSQFLPDLSGKATALVMKKADMILNIDYMKAITMGFMCGVLMQIAVAVWKHDEITTDFQKSFITILAVSIFILSGFEHSIADMFYLFASKTDLPVINQIYFILFVIFGNGLGGLFLHNAYKLKKIIKIKLDQ